MHLQDNPTSASILIADFRAPGFDGTVTYKFLDSAPADIKTKDPMDQRYGEWATIASGDVDFFVRGSRNPFGIEVNQAGQIQATVNGPNIPFGSKMTGIDKDLMPITAKDPESADGVWLDVQQVVPCYHATSAKTCSKVVQHTSVVCMHTCHEAECKPPTCSTWLALWRSALHRGPTQPPSASGCSAGHSKNCRAGVDRAASTELGEVIPAAARMLL